ncbi:MAG TPA: tape measure protein [Magnetospirillum sp.]|nr:tape measure protein [Magnetospirillum sp.]
MSVSGNLKVVISAVDRVTGPMKNINRALRGPIKAMKDVALAAGNAGRQVAAPIAVAGGMLAGAFGLGATSIIDTSSQFEKFQTILEVVEGSSEKAKASMNWVSDFAAKTPYELSEVTDAFVKLKAYGIDPQSGALKSAGDAAAAMGKPLEQAVEALADAMTGENERLKEFGITAETVGNRIAYRWVENGKNMVAVADKTNKGMIQNVVTGIWNNRFAGSMDKLSATWDGMWSNLKDTVTRFQKYIGDGGFFDAAKAELAGILTLLAQWEADGTLKEVAREISGALTAALKGLKENLAAVDWRATWDGVKAFASGVMRAVDAVGGWGNALIVVAAIMNAQTILAVGNLMGAVVRLSISLISLGARGVAALVPMLVSFGTAMIPVIASSWAFTASLLANPITWIVLGIVAAIAAIVALAAGIAWAVTHWDEFKAMVFAVGDAITGAFGMALDWAAGKLKAFCDWALGIWEDIKGIFTGDGPKGDRSWKPDISFGDQPKVQAAIQAANSNIPPAALAAPPAQAPGGAPSPAIAMAAAGRPMTGEITVSFDNAPPGMRVSQGQTNHPGVALNPTVGYRSMAVVGG